MATVISRFAKDQGYQNPPEANDKRPDISAVSEVLKLNAIMERRRSEP